MSSASIRGCVLGCLLLLAACGAPVEHGAYVPSTPSPQEAEWERIHALEREGRFDEALAGYQGMCEAAPPYERSCYDLSRLLFALERFAEGRQATARFLTRFPENPLAQPAAKRLARHHIDAGTVPAGIATLGELAATVRGSDAEDSIRYERARLCRELGDATAEAAELKAIIKAGRWESQLWDNAIWRLIELRGEQGDRADEERLLEKLLDTREETSVIGSHNSPFHDDALLRLGQLHLERGERQAAFGLFMELGRWETARLRDEGLLWAARVRFEQGKTRQGCRLLARIVDELPRASAMRDARELQATKGCR